MGKELAFFKGEIIPVSTAKVGIMTHALHYGTAVFEGIRGNWNPEKNKMFAFRLKEHYERLIKGCKILNMDINYSVEELCDLTINLIKDQNFFNVRYQHKPFMIWIWISTLIIMLGGFFAIFRKNKKINI